MRAAPSQSLSVLQWVARLAGLAVVLAATAASAASERSALMVIDANSGQVLQAERADELRHPASLTKMMTLYMVFEAIERRQMSYQTKIKISQEAASAAPTKLDLDPGETIAAIDAIKSLITKSANDMAIALGEHLAGTESNFAAMMTTKARQLGMMRTVFKNASGLPDPQQVTTARDMITLALHLQDDFPQHYPLFSTRVFSYGGSNYRNHNMLLGTFEGTDGIKTGYTRASGFNVVTSVRRQGRHVVGAVFGGDTAAARDYTMRIALSRALMRASPMKTRRPAPALVAEVKPAPRPIPAPPAPAAAQRREAPMPAPAPQVVEAAPQVAIAKVRPVMVQPRPKQAQTDQVAIAAPQVREPAPQPPFAAASTLTPLPGSGRYGLGAAPSSLSQQASNIERGAPAVVPAIALAPPAPIEVARPARVATAAAAPARVASAAPPAIAPAAATATNTAGTYEVQIGAFGSTAEASRALEAARAKAGPLLARAAPRTISVTKDARQLHRARFSGFNAQTAATTCADLRKLQIDCFVMKAE